MSFTKEGARIFLVEDNVDFAETLIEYLIREGHEVIIFSRTLASALAEMPNLIRKNINVAVVDGKLSRDSYKTADGEKVAGAIRQTNQAIHIIGFSNGQNIMAADINLPDKTPRSLTNHLKSYK